ncbi:MAG: endo-1,4-beta-xylanase [Planctomycetota bacterium]
MISSPGLKFFQLSIALVVAVCILSPFANGQQWLVEANQRIDQHRKADLTVNIVDSQGTPIVGADVHVGMKGHTFGFGTAVTASLINDNSFNGQTYRAKLLENFNHVVFENDLKFPPWLGLWGNSFNWPNTQQALNWLDANELPARGHYLSWATWSGQDAWGNSQNVNTLPQRLFDHISDIAGTVGDRVFEWDVINHPVGWLNDTYENRVSLDFYGDIVDHARASAPAGMPMWINEDDVIAGDSRADDYERIIEDLINDGSAPDGIGFQGHFIEEWGRVSNSTPQQVYDRIERFDDLLPRMRVTEFDIDVGNNEAWQGQLMHDYLTAMFSHEGIEAITMWGFWGGAHWRGANGALYRNNWTEKPSLTAYQDLVFDEWWTDEMGTSDSLGQNALRAFKGEYDITVTFDGQEYTLADYVLEGDDAVTVQLADITLPSADFDNDGDVDGDDLVVLRNNFGTYNGTDFLNWQREYSGGTSLTASQVVPEPSGIVILLLGCCATGVGARAHRF